MLRLLSVHCLLSLLGVQTFAQSSDLYLFDLTKLADRYEINRARLLSGFNPGGYTNQPSFADAYRLLTVVGPAADPLDTDIYELNLRQETITRLTKTNDREYSPMINPNHPDKMLSVVVEVDNGDNQILWSYPTDLKGGGHSVLPQAGMVGYYCPLTDDWLAVFEVGTPHKLFLYQISTGVKKFISTNIGRALRRHSDGSLVYVHKFSDSHWFLKKVNTEDFRPEVIKKTIPDAEDFILLKDDSILMGSGGKVYHLDVTGDKLWTEVADLTPFGITDITRMAFNGLNMIAIVNRT